MTQAAQQEQQGTERALIRRFAVADAALCALGLGLAALAPGGRPSLMGALCACAANLCAFPPMAWGLSRGTQGVLGGFTLGFFARMILVAIGLILFGPRDAALSFVFSFFALTFAGLAVEVGLVVAAGRVKRPQGP